MDDNFFSRNVNSDPWDYSEYKNNAGRYNRDDNKAKSDNKLMMVSVAFSSLSFLMVFILTHAKIVTLLNIFVIIVLFLACVFAVIGIITAIKVLKNDRKKYFMAGMSIILAVGALFVLGVFMMSLFAELMSEIIYSMFLY